MLKSILYFNVLLPILAFLAFIYLKIVQLTSKIDIDIRLPHSQLRGKKWILAFWHGRLTGALIIAKYCSNRYGVASDSPSGYFIQVLCRLCKITPITVQRGKIHKNNSGKTQIKEIIKLFKQPKATLGVAPDGSVGPNMKAQLGIFYISKYTKVPVVPVAFGAKRVIHLNRWDKFLLPLPFNHLKLIVGEPLAAPSPNNKDYHEFITQLENDLNCLTKEVDKN